MTTNITGSPNGVLQPQDFNLEDVNIISDTGQVFKIRNLVIELSFFEDIYTFSTSGYIIVKDALGIIEKLKMDGNEFIEIKYGKYKGQKKDNINQRKYRIYKMLKLNCDKIYRGLFKFKLVYQIRKIV